jgi:hypothetical protein
MATGAFPSASHTNTTLANVIPLVWTKEKMNNFYQEKLRAAKFFTDLSSELAGGARSVYIPNVTEMTAHAKSDASVVTLNNPTDGVITLTVDTPYECSFAIEMVDKPQIQKSYNYINTLMQNAAYTCAAAYEDAILALFVGFAQTVGTSAAALADSNVRRAIQYLDEAKCPQEDRAFFLTPKQIWSDLMALDKFSVNSYTPAANPIMTGHLGYLYGIPVIMSERISATNGSVNSCLAHKDAIVHASTVMGMDSNYIPQYMSTLCTAYVVFGVIENRDTSGVWIKTADV